MLEESTGTAQPERLDAVVVGAGFSGLYSLYRLRQEGYSVRAFDTAPDVGGTWYWNRYPGARCDVESYDYSFSFSPQLDQEWRWSERFATQPEIHNYLRHVAERFDLRKEIVFETTVTTMSYDEASAEWTVETDRGHRLSARFCVMATGPLSVPLVPKLPGLNSFAGRVLHTAAWPHDGVDFSNRRVAVVGTGSSGVQVLPIVAAQAAQCYVLQRTPNYVLPAQNQPIDDDRDREVKRNYPRRRAEAKASSSGYIKDRSTVRAFDVSAQERWAEYSRRWEQGGTSITGAFTDLKNDKAANRTLVDFLHAKIREIVRDPEVAERLLPDYPVGAKRVCVGTNFYETFNRDNVTLVDLHHEPVDQVVAEGVRTNRRTIELDDLVLATGFDAMTGALNKIYIRGRGGETVAQKWSAGPATYLGLALHGFPNLFVLAGAGSPSVLANVPTATEQQVDWLCACLGYLDSHGYRSIEPTAESEQEWVQTVNGLAEQTLFFEANSWYLGANVPGKPRVFMPYPGGLPSYVAACDEAAADGYRGFILK